MQLPSSPKAVRDHRGEDKRPSCNSAARTNRNHVSSVLMEYTFIDVSASNLTSTWLSTEKIISLFERNWPQTSALDNRSIAPIPSGLLQTSTNVYQSSSEWAVGHLPATVGRKTHVQGGAWKVRFSSSELQEYTRDGYLMARGLFDPEEIGLMRRCAESGELETEQVMVKHDREGNAVRLKI